MANAGDSTGIWARCPVWGERADFWSVIQFVRDIDADSDSWQNHATGRFAESVGIRREIPAPSPDIATIWFSGDATPDCAGGVNWATKAYFPGDVQNPSTLTCPTRVRLPILTSCSFGLELFAPLHGVKTKRNWRCAESQTTPHRIFGTLKGSPNADPGYNWPELSTCGSFGGISDCIRFTVGLRVISPLIFFRALLQNPFLIGAPPEI